MIIISIVTIVISVDQRHHGRSDLEIPDFGAAEECLQLHRTGQGGRKRDRASETVDLAPMAFHALGTGSEVSTSRRRAAVAGEKGKGIDGRRSRSGQGHLKRLEEVEFRDGRQQTLSVGAIDFVSEQVALERVFLNGVLTFTADQQAVLWIVFKQIMCAESDGRHDERRQESSFMSDGERGDECKAERQTPNGMQWNAIWRSSPGPGTPYGILGSVS